MEGYGYDGRLGGEDQDNCEYIEELVLKVRKEMAKKCIWRKMLS